ncbi:MAG: hypothetical protein IT359_13315 [Gemmatimonadaceae bacterium]|nr:hypothetical protein [Gemmatimonadaceae bacterium]
MSTVSLAAPPAYVASYPDFAVGPESALIRMQLRLADAQYNAAVSRTPLDALFADLAATWKADTVCSSSLSDIVLHPAYQRIIGLGPAVIPLIAEALRDEPHFWFDALTALTGADPVTDAHRGSLIDMTADWLAWLAQRGYGA